MIFATATDRLSSLAALLTPRRSATASLALLLTWAVFRVPECGAQTSHPRNFLTGATSRAELSRALRPRESWKPIPIIDDRAEWEAIPQEIRTSFIRAAEADIDAAWEPLPAVRALDYRRNGDRNRFQTLRTARRTRLSRLVLAEVMENRGRFLDPIANGIWAISEETFWGVPAHLSRQRAGDGLPDVTDPIIELFAAETAAQLAWTSYLVGARLDSVSPLLRERIRVEVDRRIIAPMLERDSTREEFWWMGFGERKDLNNWTPWIASNWLTSVLILEKDEARRARSVYMIMRVLDNYLNVQPGDGGSDEGPGYWGHSAASLFENLELLSGATGGRVDIFANPLIREMGRYIHRMHIDDSYYVNLGDASPRQSPDPHLLFRYGQKVNAPDMVGFAAYLRRGENEAPRATSAFGRTMRALFATAELKAVTPRAPMTGHVWLPELELMTARERPGSSEGFYMAGYGGHNDQSHNHNDVGHVTVFHNGLPVLVDPGVGDYTSQTFSDRRYEAWTMQSGFHNTPTINGVTQSHGRQFAAREAKFGATAAAVTFSVDLASAYPDSAAVESWHRTATLDRRRGEVRLRESFRLRLAKAPARLHFMTPLRPDVTMPGEVRLGSSRTGDAGGVVVLAYDPASFTAVTEEIPLPEGRLRPIWGERLARVTLVARVNGVTGDHTVTLRRAARRTP